MHYLLIYLNHSSNLFNRTFLKSIKFYNIARKSNPLKVMLFLATFHSKYIIYIYIFIYCNLYKIYIK